MRQLNAARVRRLFVVDGDRLVGVLSRRDLLRGYLRDDDVLRAQIERKVAALLADRHATVRVTVRDGVVLLLGRVEWRSALAKLDELVRAVPGVVEVRNRVGYFWDDGAAPAHRRVRSTR